MFERTADAGDRTSQAISSHAAYQSLFVDEYEMPRRAAAGEHALIGQSTTGRADRSVASTIHTLAVHRTFAVHS